MSFARGLVFIGLATALAAGPAVVRSIDAGAAVQAQTVSPVYELRTYTAAPGKMDALHTRFRDHTLRIFAKYGVSDVAYLTPIEGPMVGNTLIYTIRHENRAAADEFWASFVADPEWIEAKAESEVDGSLTTSVTRVWLTPTDYSQIR